MKMASVSVVSVFLLCCSAVTSQGCDQFAAVGGSFNVPLGYQLKPTDKLKWMFKGNIIFYKRPGNLVMGKNEDINADGSLKLTNLLKDQSGLYTPEVHDQSGRTQTTKNTNLCILDPVKKPKVNAPCKDLKVKLQCSLGQQPGGVKYEWLQNDVKMKENILSFEIKAAETKADKFACKVFNEASSETSEPVTHNCAKIDPVKTPKIIATCEDANVIFQCVSDEQPNDAAYEWLQNGAEMKESRWLFEMKAAETKGAKFVCKISNKFSSETSEPVTHNCAKTGYPEEQVGINIWVLTGARVGFILVLTIIVSICFVRVERKMKMRLKDEEELHLKRTNTEHHNHHCHLSPLPENDPPHHHQP